MLGSKHFLFNYIKSTYQKTVNDSKGILMLSEKPGSDCDGYNKRKQRFCYNKVTRMSYLFGETRTCIVLENITMELFFLKKYKIIISYEK